MHGHGRRCIEGLFQVWQSSCMLPRWDFLILGSNSSHAQDSASYLLDEALHDHAGPTDVSWLESLKEGS
jgi:hypothetical protein